MTAPFDAAFVSKYTEPPNPNWSLGQKVSETARGSEWLEGEKHGWKTVDPAVEEVPKVYQLMISGIIPRPIAFVSSISEDGVENLAPFSWFNMVTHYPPVISVSIAKAGPGKAKDTARNIAATKGFTVNIISEPFVENANVSSVEAPETVSEWPLSGLTKEPSVHVKPARVRESAFSMECELFQNVEIVHPESGQTTCNLILGLVKCIHVRQDVLNEKGLVDPAKLQPVSRLGDISYARLGDPFRISRPTWKLEGEGMEQYLTSLTQGDR
ncbi:hypothetical protein PUNSTDRAFT_110446 [Punctularia strigosozonata HHB-11173 SS5]|uniref:uncharacterized protein n=1 Tax=Punctularia strigosozonata (strain HHB-11173) TaxID=741275 RepID=UPI0004418377|nr:uncharacterized protein PUNSTDRAFT_110446 [Punctularia strigosozonata HHB-11173 SS5]EIN14335.1 hypothetical protein PUNSTDRAFT_110446 [Punctularia strigosozonata HHB-11173 SS5]